MTEEHVATSPLEAEEVYKRGGFIGNGRVNNVLAVTRAFGDFSLKPSVSADPFIRCIDLADDDEFLIVACDGLWDVRPTCQQLLLFFSLLSFSFSLVALLLLVIGVSFEFSRWSLTLRR